MMLRILAAIAIVLGLAACSGGSGSGVGKIEVQTAADQRTAIADAVQAADTAIGALRDDATDTDIADAAALIKAAEGMVSAADALPAGEREAHTRTVSLLEKNLASTKARIAEARNTRQLRMAEEAKKVTAAIASPRITGIAAAVKHEAAPVMSGTIPGTPATAVADLETVVAGETVTANGWKRGLYSVPDDGTFVDTIVLYSNIEAPGTRPFSGEGGKYSVDNGLDAEGNLPIVTATDATLIVSRDFPTGPGIQEHDADAGENAQVPGSFDGARGAYVCTPTTDSACRSSIKHGGGIDLTGGAAGWKFVPDEGATVPTPDSEYQYFGWWLRNTNGNYAVGSFHRGIGGATDEFTNLTALQGRATYAGPAAGLFAIEPQSGEASAGDFTATVTLEADFGDRTDPGTVEGTIDDFMVNGQAEDWSVELQAAQIGTHGAIIFGNTATALTYWTIGDTKAQTTATWSGQFHEAGADSTPVVATGQFEARHGNIGRMIGVFGATR